ncbi:MAG: GuaB3 family IMP dehydrogenase-related protein [Chloroflexi bacterium]|nr:GuaB3 family IMP dehydrogenase-related protein [Chloroflexota bacterium]MQC82839.1 GuaB3 family IMP dehydrogenase-related protein [Chloroflexota bacterium]
MAARPKQLDHSYGFDDVAIVPGAVTTNPELVEPTFTLGEHTFRTPIIASSMDGVVDPKFAIRMTQLGGLAVLNLDGVWTRYEDADAVLEEIAAASIDQATATIQRIYSEPVKEHLVGQRVEEIKAGGGIAIVAGTPQNTKKFAPITKDAGTDYFVVASTVTTARHVSSSLKGLRLDELVRQMDGVPILVGNTVDFQATLELMDTGVHGVLVGVGPGAACTSREVLGIGMPQVSATIETAYARDVYFERTGRYVPIITDGGLRTGGDVSKSICAGADAVMIGSPFASCEGAPGRGFHWGMATPHSALPRGVRVEVGQTHTVEKLLFGPTSQTNGTENLVGALTTSMATCGARTIQEFHDARMIIAPSIKTEGKIYQIAQTRPAGV